MKKFAQETKEAFEVNDIVAAPIVRTLLDRLTREGPTMEQVTKKQQKDGTTTTEEPKTTENPVAEDKTSKEDPHLSVEIDGEHHKVKLQS